MSESRNQISELVATVEAVGEFGKIARPIFLTPGVVGAIQGPLDVAEHRVHPPQARRLAAARPPSGYPRAVLTSCFLHSRGRVGDAPVPSAAPSAARRILQKARMKDA